MFINKSLPISPQPATVDTPSPAFEKQHLDSMPCRDLMGGTEAMRRAGKRYIPQEPGEEATAHQQRIARTVLRNIYKQTLQYNRGQVLSSDIALDGVSSGLDASQVEFFDIFKENVDQRGQNLTSWAGNVFQQGLVDGVTFCFVDFPNVETENLDGGSLYRTEDGEWRQRSLQAEKQEGWEPYLVHVKAENMLDVRADWIDGKRRITHFRYLETMVEDNPDNVWGQRIVQYVRSYWTDHWELWRKREQETKFELIADGRLSLDELPLAVFMPGDKRTEFTAQPALMDLAWLNIRHWQATCEQNDLMSFVRRPPWYIIGVDIENATGETPKNAFFGPGHILYLPLGSSIGSAGVNPSCVDAGRQDLKDLEDAMAVYGLQLLQKTVTSMTATQVQRESAENNSVLKNWALLFQDFLENCLYYVGLWKGYQDGPSVKVNDTFAATANTDYLLQLHDKGLISKETLAALMKRAAILPDDFDFEQETDRLARDNTNSANAGQSFLDRLRNRQKDTGGKQAE